MNTETSQSQGGVWADLVGQERLIAVLQRGVAGDAHAMTHAWLFTGPPGSGRSNAAKAFAAALQCEQSGCGKCNACLTAISGAHPDVTLVRTEALSIGVDEVRDLVRRAAIFPAMGRYQILVVEDADRITERGADALLKAIEEPASRTIWMLCAPTAEDVVVTIRSRCRQVELITPSQQAIATLLQTRDGIDSQTASFAARVAQGHIGRARAMATNEEARARRLEILRLPTRLNSLGAALAAADNLVKSASAEAVAITAELDVAETARLKAAIGVAGTKGRPRQAAALRELEDEQKARVKRIQRDALDRVLTELTSYYRDVLTLQIGADTPFINAELVVDIEKLANGSTAEETMHKLDAILHTRTALDANVAPLLAIESLLISLGHSGQVRLSSRVAQRRT